MSSYDPLASFIHQPTRLIIMTHLYSYQEADAKLIKRKTNLTWGNLSSHMSKLEEKGLVEVTKKILDKKMHTTFKITPEGVEEFEKYRTSMIDLLKNDKK